GMSEVLGPLAYDKAQSNNFLGGMNARRMVSDDTAQAIDKEVKDIVETAHQQALGVLRENKELLETISEQLLEKEVIEGDGLRQMLAKVYGEQHSQPVEQVVN
ncbi:cell division protein FtsH, partial [Acaryochloris marina NIES-2412]